VASVLPGVEFVLDRLTFLPTESTLESMTFLSRNAIASATAVILLGLGLSGCSSAPSQEGSATPSSAAPAQVPDSARYMADMQSEAKPMVLGISVEGENVAAYACNGSDEEAWFFGTQKDGNVQITSRFGDTLQGRFNGDQVEGTVVMAGLNYTFDAAEVPDPAGMYAAQVNGVHASWVVRPDGRIEGVQHDGFVGGVDGHALEAAGDPESLAEARSKRELRTADKLVKQQDGSWTSTINGAPVQAEVVDGDFRWQH